MTLAGWLDESALERNTSYGSADREDPSVCCTDAATTPRQPLSSNAR